MSASLGTQILANSWPPQYGVMGLFVPQFAYLEISLIYIVYPNQPNEEISDVFHVIFCGMLVSSGELHVAVTSNCHNHKEKKKSYEFF